MGRRGQRGPHAGRQLSVGCIVVKQLTQHSIHRELSLRLHGILGGREVDQDRVAVTAPEVLQRPVLSADEVH